MEKPKFELGRLAATPAALKLMMETATNPTRLLERHATGDWGDVDAQDRARNDEALVCGARVLSAYPVGKPSQHVWIITEADRSITTILLPSDY